MVVFANGRGLLCPSMRSCRCPRVYPTYPVSHRLHRLNVYTTHYWFTMEGLASCTLRSSLSFRLTNTGWMAVPTFKLLNRGKPPVLKNKNGENLRGVFKKSYFFCFICTLKQLQRYQNSRTAIKIQHIFTLQCTLYLKKTDIFCVL